MAVRYVRLSTAVHLTFTLCPEAHQLASCGELHPAAAKHDVSVPARMGEMHLNKAVFT